MSEPTTLNDWQKSVLEAQGLSTDYDELKPIQQLSIDRMYEMKKYLDDKYGMEFEYEGYTPSGLMDKEQFIAYPKELGIDGGRNYVTVEVDENGNFTDNYVSTQLKDKFEKMYNDFVQDYFHSEKAVVFPDHFECEYEDLSEMKDDFYDFKIFSETQIFISDSVCDEEGLKRFTAAYYEWLCQNGIYCNARISVVHDNLFESINYLNYTDFYNEKSMVYDIGIFIYDDMSYSNTTFAVYKNENGKIVCEREEINLDEYTK